MSKRALVTSRAAAAAPAEMPLAAAAIERAGVTIEDRLPHGTLVTAEDEQLAELERQGYRVKVLADPDVLTIGGFRIDITAPPPVSSRFALRAEAAQNWRHFLIQLTAPPTPDWISQIEDRGVDVVEPISTYGLFVDGSQETVEALKELPFVRWVGRFEPEYRVHPLLAPMTGVIQYVRVDVYPESEAPDVAAALQNASAQIVREFSEARLNDGQFYVFIAELDAQQIPAIAAQPAVRWMEFASSKPGLDGERETQIVAENLNGAAAPATAPIPGYQPWLGTVGLSGTGVTVAICDTGVDANANNNATGHVDIRSRQTAFVDYTGGTVTTDTDGHGTHVAGIAVGNAATGQTEAAAPNNFLWGQGMAPQANYVTQNALFMSPWPPADFATLTRDSVNNGAQVMNNSWWDGGPAGSGYTANARRFDELVRDPNKDTASLDYLVVVFSAGNSGPGDSTLTPPKEAKNPITVGNALTFRPGTGDPTDDIRGIATTSSRGPALDGRILPNVVAPGTNVSAAYSRTSWRTPIAGTGQPDPMNPAQTINQYLSLSGTSMAAPHVTGSCALLIEWWRQRTGGKNPSPAMLKGLLINGAEDLAGGPDGDGGNLTNIPNNDQGWGRVSLENILLQAPASDRGPRLFTDQTHPFTANGQEHMIRVAPVDATRPLRVTLVWTDAPGAAGSNPALVNDLDLEVTETGTGNIYKGNVFTNGFSTTGGAFDNLNNIECVYRQNPSGVYEIRVIAANITRDARPPHGAIPWQDWALVIENAEVPAAAPVSVVPVIDRSGSMSFYGYVDVTRTASKQFIDLMGVDDQLGVVSFSNDGVVEYPAMPALQTITGQPIRDAAKTEVDGIAFGGNTYMGDGLAKGRDLLAAATGSRAMVLLSDGYDNKAFVPSNPSALDVVATLPPDLRVYTCAMGPSSDQALLEQIADATNGHYYFMPTIDDLFEIYNYIRGQVTGEAIVANESASASSSRVGGFVDSLATEATFAVGWANPRLRYVASDPRKATDISVRLRDPRGRLLHAHSSYVRRTVGDNYVLFEMQEPLPGQWYAEVETGGESHTRYTVGAFVRSPLRLLLTPRIRTILRGAPIQVAAQVYNGNTFVSGITSSAVVKAPAAGVATLLDRYKNQLQDMQMPRGVKDLPPGDLGKLSILRDRLLQQGQKDIFSTVSSTVRFRQQALRTLPQIGFAHLAPSFNTSTATAFSIGQFTKTKEAGSYNVIVNATGAVPGTRTRFVRKDMMSVLVK